MSKRVTIVVEDDLIKKLRTYQAKLIKDSEKNISLSKIINELVAQSLKNK